MKRHVYFPSEISQLERDILQYRKDHDFFVSTAARRIIGHMLQSNALRHSVEMEVDSHQGNGHKRKAVKEALRRTQQAWEYLKETINSEGGFGEANLIRAARMIIPNQRFDPHTQYRSESVTIRDATYAPPPPNYDPSLSDEPWNIPVPTQMQTMMSENSTLETDFERAIYTHFHIARIHPFPDGNGRLARLTQNAYLHHGMLFPVMIPTRDKNLYASILDDGVKLFYDGDSRYLKSFSQYIAGKMKESFFKMRHPVH